MRKKNPAILCTAAINYDKIVEIDKDKKGIGYGFLLKQAFLPGEKRKQDE